MRRAVREAITVLQDQGHTIVRFCPPGLAKVSALYTQLVGADNGVSTLNLVKNSDIDWNSWGPGYYSFKLPLWLRQKVSSLVSLMSPMSANMLTTNQHSWRSAELWELNNYRLELTEHILREWDRQGIDVVIAPGLAMPAQPIGYPAWELPAASYTCVYNVLNFPAGSIPVSYNLEQFLVTGYDLEATSACTRRRLLMTISATRCRKKMRRTKRLLKITPVMRRTAFTGGSKKEPKELWECR